MSAGEELTAGDWGVRDGVGFGAGVGAGAVAGAGVAVGVGAGVGVGADVEGAEAFRFGIELNEKVTVESALGSGNAVGSGKTRRASGAGVSAPAT